MTPNPALNPSLKLRTLARVVRSIAIARGDPISAAAYADARGDWRNTPEVAVYLKSAVSAVGTADGLISLNLPMGLDLAAALQPATIVGRLDRVRRVPARVRVVHASADAAGAFVAEDAPAPVAALEMDDSADTTGQRNMQPWPFATIAVLTRELLERAPRGTDAYIAGEIVRLCRAGLDRAFVDPDALVPAVGSPAPVTADAAYHRESTGSTLASIDGDLRALQTMLIDAGHTLETAVYVLDPRSAAALAAMRGTGGVLAYPNISATGGTLAGLPALCSSACTESGSPSGRFIALIEQDGVTVCDDPAALRISYSSNAALQMTSAPADGPQQLLSLWPNGLSAVRVDLATTWTGRPGAVATLRRVQF